MRDCGEPARASGLIGRGPELARLFACAVERRPLALVRGGAGAGKSSLLQAARQRFDEAAEVLSAAAPAPARPFGVVHELLAPFAGIDAAPGPQADRFPLLAELARPVLAASSRGLTVLLIDDAVSADDDSVHWLDFLLRRVADGRLLVVLALPEGETGPLADLVAEHEAVTVRLGPLPIAGVRQVVERRYGDEPDAGFAEVCLRATAGNPRRLSRLLGELATQGIRPDAAAVPRVATTAKRLLEAEAQEYVEERKPYVGVVLRALAVLGDAGVDDPAVLPVVADLSSELVAEALDDLRRDGLLHPGTAAPLHPEFAVAALAAVSGAERDRLRRRAATVLSEQGVPAGKVARLLVTLSDLPDPWMHRVLYEAAIAEQAEDQQTAMRYLSRILELPSIDADPLLRMAESAAGADPAPAASFLRDALDRIPDVRARALLAPIYGAAALAAFRCPEAFAVLDRLRAELDQAGGGRGDEELRGRLRAVLTAVALADESTTAEVLARPWEHGGGDSYGSRTADGLTAYAAMLSGRCAGAVARRARRALVQGLPVHYPAAAALSYAGQPREALAALDRLQNTAEGEPHLWDLTARALVLERLGELPAAAAVAESAVDGASERTGNTEAVTWPAVRLASVLLAMGRPDRAGAVLSRVRRAHFGWLYPEAELVSVALRRRRGDQEGALAVLLECGRRLVGAGVRNPVFAPWWLAATCLLTDLERPGEAAELAEYGVAQAREWQTPEAAGLAQLAVGVAGRGAARLDALARAVDLLGAAEVPLTLARAKLVFGRALLGVDDLKGARAHLRDALALANRSGASALASTAQDLLVSAGGRVHTRWLCTLSRAELRVAELAAAGDRNREIADQLFVSLRTVETHLSSVYRKLGIELRAELAAALLNRAEVQPA
ncbi:LuxR C-terminal-related transcriptional regulator [Amycolatopsis sp. PS_44_ISF1]|uniref:helix-turn-helix transcriptional regulator n=1 Tax=Amycolatopsis sp. PS_44_ISF1 TaxID=2974917 RepID=UPI0028DE54A3|nr:LuxR C-terminal-related transcriptional regulator [Amycolatopsis sp. PS_44_ISF1]MDT8913878.1 LuxR C-terminal-related transcriptional regulator [Amycolatopsis sp. PS_44_ISF1]